MITQPSEAGPSTNQDAIGADTALGELRKNIAIHMGKDIANPAVEAVFRTAEAYAQRRVDAQSNEVAIAYTEEIINMFRALRPARPEDLSTSQWYGLVEAIDAGIVELKSSLSQLNQTTGDKS